MLQFLSGLVREIKTILITVSFVFCGTQKTPTLAKIGVYIVRIGSGDQRLAIFLRQSRQMAVIIDLILTIVRLNLIKIVMLSQLFIPRV